MISALFDLPIDVALREITKFGWLAKRYEKPTSEVVLSICRSADEDGNVGCVRSPSRNVEQRWHVAG
jgi:hypothetical protein